MFMLFVRLRPCGERADREIHYSGMGLCWTLLGLVPVGLAFDVVDWRLHFLVICSMMENLLISYHASEVHCKLLDNSGQFVGRRYAKSGP